MAYGHGQTVFVTAVDFFEAYAIVKPQIGLDDDRGAYGIRYSIP